MSGRGRGAEPGRGEARALMILRIIEATVFGPHVLQVTFDDGTTRLVDVWPLLEGPSFEPLHDPAYFARVAVDPIAGTVVWPNGADFAPEALRALPALDGNAHGADASSRAASILKKILASIRPALLDTEFDDLPAKKVDSALDGPAIRERSGNWLRGVWPIGRSAQVVFAETFRQGLDAGLTADRALGLAADVTPGRRFRRALRELKVHVRSGYTIEASLAKTGVRVAPRLRAALKVGQEHGGLAEELAAFARSYRRLSSRAFQRAIGRSPEAVRFAGALARLLRGERLTVRVVRAAGEIATGGRGFARVAADVAQRIEDGYPLVEALRFHPRHFDPLFLGLLEVAATRDELRTCLGRLGGGEGA